MIRSFQSFGATLVQFQKFEQRFGPGPPPDEERNRQDLTYEDALALQGPGPGDARRVAPSGTSGTPP